MAPEADPSLGVRLRLLPRSAPTWLAASKIPMLVLAERTALHRESSCDVDRARGTLRVSMRAPFRFASIVLAFALVACGTSVVPDAQPDAVDGSTDGSVDIVLDVADDRVAIDAALEESHADGIDEATDAFDVANDVDDVASQDAPDVVDAGLADGMPCTADRDCASGLCPPRFGYCMPPCGPGNTCTRG